MENQTLDDEWDEIDPFSNYKKEKESENDFKKQDLLESLERLDFIDTQVFYKIKYKIAYIYEEKIENFDKLQLFFAEKSVLDGILKELINELNEDSKPSEQATEAIQKLNELSLEIFKKIQETKINFINTVLVSSEQESILFNNELSTKEAIEKRFKKLSLFFHPDKSDSIDDKLANDLFLIISGIKNKLLDKLEEETKSIGELNYYRQKGNESWKKSLEIRASLNKKFTEELEKERKSWVNDSFVNYKAACKVADKYEKIDDQISLRGTLALCQFSLKNIIEAQIYALSSIKLILKNSNLLSKEIITNAQKILERVQKGKQPQTETQPTVPSQSQSTQIDKYVDNNQVSLAIVDFRNLSITDEKRIYGKMKKELGELEAKMIVKCDQSLVQYTADEEIILRAKEKAKTYQAVGLAVGVAGVGAGAAVVGIAGIEVLQGFGLVAGAALGGPVFAIAAGLGAICFGIYGGYRLIKTSNQLLEEPTIREKLNEIIRNSVKIIESNEEKYKNDQQKRNSDFLRELSKEYDQGGNRLFQLTTNDIIIKSDEIIKSLLMHGFRPDGIAYLLNLIGEVLLNPDTKIENLTSGDLKNRAFEALNGTLNQKLETESDKIDERILEFQRQSFIRHFKSLKDTFMLKIYSDIAKEHIKDAQKMTVRSRLEEMRNIAKINMAIIRIIIGDDDELNKATNLINQVRESIEKNYQFQGKSSLRLEVVEDFLWAVSGKYKEPARIEMLESPSSIPQIKELQNSLKNAKTAEEKLDIQNKIAEFYENEAEKEAPLNKLNSFNHYQEAKNAYSLSLQLCKTNPAAGIGFARCLLKLSKYELALNALKHKPHLEKLADYWVILSISSMKTQKKMKENKLDKAATFINKALTISPTNREAKKTREILTTLKEEPYEMHNLATLDKKKEYYLNTHRIGEAKYYKIISIDGGGVRGLMPAIWLNEIEKKSRKPISHLFNMISGTSCGGIIAAGLSCPEFETNTNPTTFIQSISDYKPKYAAGELVKLFRNESKNIFTGKSFFYNLNPFTDYTSAKYTDSGRETLFEKYFGNISLKNSLTELLIPAFNENKQPNTYLFSRFSSKSDPNKDFYIKNVLMATSAAPTFFDSFKIGDNVFLDGGVNLNNPALTAYTEALKYGAKKEKTFVLSLGSGTCIPDPLNPDSYRGKLFWSQNIHKVVLAAQEANTDVQMCNLLGDKYQRWQVWMEEPIALDSYDDQSLDFLTEMARQHIEEQYASDTNNFNKLIEFLKGDE